MGKHLHRLSAIDPTAKTATCAHCGPVAIRLRSRTASHGSRTQGWVCGVVNSQRSLATAREPAYRAVRNKAARSHYYRTNRALIVSRLVTRLQKLSPDDLAAVLGVVTAK